MCLNQVMHIMTLMMHFRDIGFRHAQFVDGSGDTFRWKVKRIYNRSRKYCQRL